MQSQSYVRGRWRCGDDEGVAMCDATTGEINAHATSAGIDFADVVTQNPRRPEI